uniref:Sperm-associated antigen 1 n=1 Tax=Camelus bactrianus TaxID=9837 RepID=A0A9W3G6V6_CAMBA|nr:sperm-associated antigen 1 [Camelus bactrianus]
MTAKDYPSLWGFGTTKTFKIPVEHLDFKYIEKCSDVKHLEKILCVLRSGEEGYYPELTEFCEKRLTGLAPESRALRKDKPAATSSSFTAEEWEKIDGDIKSWVSEIKKEDDKIHFHETETFPAMEDNLPPVRGSNSHLHVAKEKNSKSRPAKKKIPRDYAEWDKFDVEKECSKIDEDYKEKTVVNNKAHLSKIETRLDTAGLTEKEKDFLATREKEKGNEAFNSGDYEEAVMYYTRSISVLPSVAAYNNRAQAELKLQSWNSAFRDCEKVLELEPGNIKALLRRATTYKHQNKLQEAIEDLNKVLDVEPHNELAKKTLSEVERDLKNSEPASKTQVKGKRMVIQEVENSEDEGGKDHGRKHEDGSGDKSKTSFLFCLCKKPFSCYVMSWFKFSVCKKILCLPDFLAFTFWGRRGGSERGRGGQPSGRTRPWRRGNLGVPPKGRWAAPTGSQALEMRLAEPKGATAGPAQATSRMTGARLCTFLPGDRGQGGCDLTSPSSILERAACALARRVRSCPYGLGLCDHCGPRRRLGAALPAVCRTAVPLQASVVFGNAEDLSILYSNRAACYIKDGNCSGCIQDCNRALELHPFSVKPLLRRAMAYETLEQYQKAYVDYKTVLQIDCGIQIANDSINRITRILMALDGPSWREKLSPIPAVPTSAQLRAWQPAAEAAPEQVGDSCSHQQPGATDEKMFKTLKEEGNQYVKDKNYKDALSKYSECLKINNKECAIYTNRALCYLKLCQFEEAKQDCDQALQIDNRNVKACYRRALAHKGLKNYQKSLNDLNKVLLLDPGVVEAKMELEEVTRILNTEDGAASFNKEKERRKIEIQEVNGGHKEPERTSEEVSTHCLAFEKGDTSNGPREFHEQLPIAKPNNAYEFGQLISALSARKDGEACAHLLAITEPKDLPVLLSNKLEGDTFLLLIQSLKNNLIDKDPSLVYQHLLYLSEAERFKMMLTLISMGQKEQIKQLFDDLSDTPSPRFTLEDVQALRRQYEL